MRELDNIESLIIRSLDQTASEGDLMALNNWVNESAENKNEYFRIKDVWDTTSTFAIEDPQDAWKAFEKQTYKTGNFRKLGVELMKVAAVAAVVFMASYFLFNMPKVNRSEVKYAKVSVPNGATSTVELPDGTIVKLNAGSELKYPSFFDKDIRQVELTGEGYFEVQHNTAHPFVVAAGDIEVRVLGTEFNVMAYPEFNRIETTLINGKVMLNKKGLDAENGVVLMPGQKAVYADGKLTVNRANIDIETDWVQNSFYFQNTSFNELITRLEKWYDVDIVMEEGDFNDITFTGKFRNKETIWQVLEAIKMTTPIAYNAKESKIYITLLNK